MSQKPPQNNSSSKKPGFFQSFTDAIDSVVNEVKADIKSMTPPGEGADGKKAAQQQAYNSRMMGIVGQSAAGIGEEIVGGAEVPSLPPEQDESRPETKKTATGLPPGNLWDCLKNPEFTNRLRTDACYHALTTADVTNYQKAVAAESAMPFTMGILAIVLQAPLEEELEEGGIIVADDMLLTALLKSLEENRVYGAIGAGPRQIWPNFDALDEALTNLLNTYPKLVALGPLGIDEPFAPYQLENQKAQFAVQLDIAADFNLPVILSHRQSLKHMANVLEQVPALPPLIWLDPLTGEEDAALVKKFNMYVALRPEVTAPDFAYAHLYRNIPTERLLMASGSALVAPHGFSGHFNQPKFLHNTMQASAKMLFQTERDITSITNKNLAMLFNAQKSEA